MTSSKSNWTLEKISPTAMLISIDVEGSRQNTFSTEVLAELEDVLIQLESDKELTRVLFRSSKPGSFFAGAQIHEFQQLTTAEDAEEISRRGQDLFGRIAALKPTTIVLIDGVCLGGGLEFALACDFRIAVNSAATRLGLPETQLGILPGWGGTQRLPALIGPLETIGMILQAKRLTPDRARKIGLVDEVITTDQIEATVSRCLTGELPSRTKQKTSFFSWFVNQTSWGRNLLFSRTEKRIAQQIKQYPALGMALEAIRKSYGDSTDGYHYEQHAIGQLVLSSTSQNLVQLFLNQERARNLKTWLPEGASMAESWTSLGVLGGGTMGAGIAHVALRKGLKVVVKEMDEEAAAAARTRIESTYQELIRRRSLTEAETQAQMDNLITTADWDALSGVEGIVEAVPETLELKQMIFQEVASKVESSTLLATNTSALSVDEIFRDVPQPERTGGIHFFNPVHRMDLVEVISGDATSTESLGEMLQLTRQLGKTPIVTKDSPGFIVNRILMPYLDEAVKLAIDFSAQQQKLSVIDKEMRAFGMPMGPLELLDQVGVDVAAHVANSLHIVFGQDSITALVLQRMVDEGRLGKKSDAGFYNYVHGRKTDSIGLQPLLEGIEVDLEVAGETPFDETLTPIQQRLAMAMVNEAGRCLDEQVVPEAWMIDMAMVLGTGFAPFRGGPLKFATQWTPEELSAGLKTLAAAYGDRFQPANSIARGLEHIH